MDIRKIRHATVLAAEGNFVRAAAKLHITQSALSQSISRLEHEIGLTLFDRNRRSVVLTSAGKEFIARAEDLLISQSTLVHEVERIRGGEIGRISLGFSSVPADILLKPVLLDIAKHRPRLQVNVELANNEDLLEHLLAERIEFFVAGTSMIDPGKRTVVRELARDHVAFFVRKRHALASRPKATIADLEEFPVLCTPIVTEGQNRTRRWLGLSKADPLPPTMVCDDLAALKYLALNSDAVLISPRSALATECAAGKLIELRLSEQRYPGSTGMWLVTLANRTPSPAAAMIIQHVETLLHDLMLNNGARRRATPVRHSAPQRTLQAHAKNLVDR